MFIVSTSISRQRPHFRPPPGEFRTFFTIKLVGIWLWVDFTCFEPIILRFYPHLQHFEIRPTCSSTPFGQQCAETLDSLSKFVFQLEEVSFSLYVYNCLLYVYNCLYFFIIVIIVLVLDYFFFDNFFGLFHFLFKIL